MEGFWDDVSCIGDENKWGRLLVFDKIREGERVGGVEWGEDEVFVFWGKGGVWMGESRGWV